MYIYNVTISVDKDIATKWLQWMKTVHIPEVMNTGYFLDYKMSKVLNVDDEGETYSVQYTFSTMDDIESYQKNDGPRLQAETKKLYDGKYIAFRTLLEIV